MPLQTLTYNGIDYEVIGNVEVFAKFTVRKPGDPPPQDPERKILCHCCQPPGSNSGSLVYIPVSAATTTAT